MTRQHDSFIGIGVSVLALACVPRVSANIVVSEPDPPDAEAEDDTGDKKDGPKTARSDRRPPGIIRAEYVNSGHLRLHFSEPLAEPTGFDPNDFRLSVLTVYIYGNDYNQGYAYNNYGSYSHGYYADFGYSYSGSPLHFVRWKHESNELDLYFSPELSPYACRQINNTNDYDSYAPPGVRYEHGLFLHYAAGAIPIRDEEGNPLANIGADWVLYGRNDPGASRNLEESEIETAGQGLLRLSCEVELPPGPR